MDGRNVELGGEASEAKQDRIRRRDIKVARLLFEDGGREREQRVEGEMDGCEGQASGCQPCGGEARLQIT